MKLFGQSDNCRLQRQRFLAGTSFVSERKSISI
jgi:hypothetical protein